MAEDLASSAGLPAPTRWCSSAWEPFVCLACCCHPFNLASRRQAFSARVRDTCYPRYFLFGLTIHHTTMSLRAAFGYTAPSQAKQSWWGSVYGPADIHCGNSGFPWEQADSQPALTSDPSTADSSPSCFKDVADDGSLASTTATAPSLNDVRQVKSHIIFSFCIVSCCRLVELYSGWKRGGYGYWYHPRPSCLVLSFSSRSNLSRG